MHSGSVIQVRLTRHLLGFPRIPWAKLDPAPRVFSGSFSDKFLRRCRASASTSTVCYTGSTYYLHSTGPVVQAAAFVRSSPTPFNIDTYQVLIL